MSIFLAAALGTILSIVLVICLHFTAAYIPALVPFKELLAVLCMFGGLTFATLATRWYNKKKTLRSNNSSLDIDFNTGPAGASPASSPYGAGSGGGAGSTRNFAAETISPAAHLNSFSAIPLANTVDLADGLDAIQITESASDTISSAMDVSQGVEVGEELGEVICEVVGSLLE